MRIIRRRITILREQEASAGVRKVIHLANWHYAPTGAVISESAP